MKRIAGIKIGGLQQKILSVLLVFLMILIACGLALTFYKAKSLRKIVNEAREEQQQSVSSISENTIYQMLEAALVTNTALKAEIADDSFSEIVNNIRLMQTIAQQLFEAKDKLDPAPYSAPDASMDGIITARALSEEGVDIYESKYLGIAAHMTDVMKGIYINSDKVDSCYIGLDDGTHFEVDDASGSRFDENGNLLSLAVHDRPWYKGAVETGDLYFTGIVTDAFNGKKEIMCSAPVVVQSEIQGVVGMDINLENMEKLLRLDEEEDNGGFAFIVNQDGQVVLAPNNNEIFTLQTEDIAIDLRKSSNIRLAEFIEEALVEPTSLNLVPLAQKQYYMAGAPMGTIGWTLITAVDKSITELPTKQMLDKINSINANATAAYEEGTKTSSRTMLIAAILIILVASASALMVAGKIVRPVEEMTRSIEESSRTGKMFEMKDVYKTKDEIEVLAVAFDDLSKRTRQYILDITKITKEKERIGTELELARKIQADMLPNVYPAFPERKEFDIYATMHPAKEVGGDFYDFFLIDDDHLGMVIADVSGKGVPAALFMMMSKMLINNYAMMGASPAKVLEMTNDAICKNNEEEMFVTAWFGILEISSRTVVAANAGHEYPIIKKPNGDFEIFKDKHGFVIGGFENMKYTEYKMKLEKGSVLFLYTDGVPEATNKDEKLFGTKGMLEVINKYKDNDPKSLLENMKAEIDDFVGEADQFDDLTMLGFKMLK